MQLAKVMPKLSRNEVQVAMCELEFIDAHRITLGEAFIKEGVNTSYRYITWLGLPSKFPLSWTKGYWQSWKELQRAKANHQFMVARVRLLAG